MNTTNDSMSISRINVSVSFVNTSATLTQAKTVWNFADTFSLLTILLAFTLNLTVIVLFCKESTCRTSFNYYIVNLCLANLVYTLVYPIDVLNDRYPFHLPPLTFCLFFRYITYVTAAQINNAHLLLALNRLWAVTWPIAYRQFHSSNTASSSIKICLSMWAYCSLCVLPGIVLDGLAPRVPAEMYHCSSNVVTPWTWQASTQILVYDVPIAVTLVVYPFILYRTFQIAREKASKIGHSKGLSRAGYSHHDRTRRTSKEIANQEQPEMLGHGKNIVDTEGERLPVRKGRGHCTGTSGNFLTLSLLIVNVTCSLVPAQVFSTLLVFGKFVQGMYIIMWILYSLGPIVDALLFLLTVRTFFNALKMSCSCA